MSLIGWVVNPEILVEKFSIKTPEEFVMKVRHDPDTGKQLKNKQKVVTKKSTFKLMFNGQSIIDEAYPGNTTEKWFFHERIAELICKELSIEYEIEDNGFICFGLFLEDGEKFSNILKMNTKLEAVRKKLIKHGIPFNKKSSPVFASYSY